jgi:putative tricarboxylic transport membrane protein
MRGLRDRGASPLAGNLIVPMASPFRSLSDLITAFRQQPESISWAGGAISGTEQMLVLMISH